MITDENNGARTSDWIAQANAVIHAYDAARLLYKSDVDRRQYGLTQAERSDTEGVLYRLQIPLEPIGAKEDTQSSLDFGDPGIAEDRWVDFLKRSEEQGRVTNEVARVARGISQRLRASHHAPPPDAMINDEGALLMVWTNGSNHLQVRVLPSGAFEWFYLNKTTRLDDAGEVPSGREPSIPEKVLEYFAMVA